jgi:hypothetical protein
VETLLSGQELFFLSLTALVLLGIYLGITLIGKANYEGREFPRKVREVRSSLIDERS